MTPKEFNFWFQVLEEAVQHAYSRGHADRGAGKPEEDHRFILTKEHKLLIKSELNKYTKKA